VTILKSHVVAWSRTIAVHSAFCGWRAELISHNVRRKEKGLLRKRARHSSPVNHYTTQKDEAERIAGRIAQMFLVAGGASRFRHFLIASTP